MQGLSDLLAGGQIAGTRRHQEDNFRILAFRESDGAACDLLLVVADGMGGHRGGARASEVAVTAFAGRFTTASGGLKVRLRRALEAANAAVGAAAADEGCAGMGCTLVACAVVGDDWRWISVGDSMLWLLGDGGLRRLNADHSMRPVLEDLVELGRMTREELAADASVHQLRSALTGEELALIDENDPPRGLRVGDRIVLASDGLATLAPDDVASACSAGESASDAVDELLRRVEAAGRSSQDNATVVVYRHARPGTIRRRFAALEAPTRPIRRAAGPAAPRPDSGRPAADAAGGGR